LPGFRLADRRVFPPFDDESLCSSSHRPVAYFFPCIMPKNLGKSCGLPFWPLRGKRSCRPESPIRKDSYFSYPDADSGTKPFGNGLSLPRAVPDPAALPAPARFNGTLGSIAYMRAVPPSKSGRSAGSSTKLDRKTLKLPKQGRHFCGFRLICPLGTAFHPHPRARPGILARIASLSAEACPSPFLNHSSIPTGPCFPAAPALDCPAPAFNIPMLAIFGQTKKKGRVFRPFSPFGFARENGQFFRELLTTGSKFTTSKMIGVPAGISDPSGTVINKLPIPSSPAVYAKFSSICRNPLIYTLK